MIFPSGLQTLRISFINKAQSGTTGAVHGDNFIEIVIGKSHILSVHLHEGFNLLQIFFGHLELGSRQHVRRKINTDDLDILRIEGQGQTGPHTNLENTLLGLTVQQANRPLSTRMKDGTKNKIIKPRITPVSCAHGLQCDQ